MGRTIFIGDVHGCREELGTLINKLPGKLDGDTHLVFLGDLIHKGPQSQIVVNYVRFIQGYGELEPEFNAKVTCIKGNHEERHERWFIHEDIRIRTGKKNPMTHCEGYAGMLPSHQIGWMEDLPLYIKGPDWIAVHGGIPPKMKTLPPPTISEIKKLPKREREIALSMLRIRYHDRDGNQVKMGDEKPSDSYWAETYDGRFGHVYFGHQTMNWKKYPVEFEHATPLDYGCVHGGLLTACIIEDGKEPILVSVPAIKQYQPMLQLMARHP